MLVLLYMSRADPSLPAGAGLDVLLELEDVHFGDSKVSREVRGGRDSRMEI